MTTYQQCPMEQRLTARARTLLDRIERLDTSGCHDLSGTQHYELAEVQMLLDLLTGPYLTLRGWKYAKEKLGWIEEWIMQAETDNE